MCGIAGVVWRSPAGRADDDVLAAMTDSLAHRGPDDRAMFRSEYAARPGRGDLPGCGLGFRRLSIIDPTSGRQPLTNEDGSVHVVCNGEIYNFVDLRRRLEGRGHVFRTGSDAEAIVHLYEDEGPACIQRLVGMFALGDLGRESRSLGAGSRPLRTKTAVLLRRR